MHRSVTALALIFALGAAGHAAPPVVKATATSPESPATLAPQQSLYVRTHNKGSGFKYLYCLPQIPNGLTANIKT